MSGADRSHGTHVRAVSSARNPDTHPFRHGSRIHAFAAHTFGGEPRHGRPSFRQEEDACRTPRRRWVSKIPFQLQQAGLLDANRVSNLALTLSRALPDFTEILPDGEKEKQLIRGLLNQRDKLEQVIGHGILSHEWPGHEWPG
jgi:hypothetical protein